VIGILEVRDDFKSSRCAVGIHNKERCLVPEIRASTMLSLDFVNKNIESISQANALLIEGYFVIERFDIIQLLIKQFHSLGKKVIFTLSAVFMVEFHTDKMLEVSNESHMIFANIEEAEAFTKIGPGKTPEEVSIALHKLLKPLDRILVVTCGKDPVVISKYNYEQNEVDFILKSFVYPVPSEEIVDTNGCGDSFVGGFLSQYIQGKSLEVCARMGNFASSVIIRNVGCTYPLNLDLDKLKI
jgi:adenosine kinase